jgi:hypothetical protein
MFNGSFLAPYGANTAKEYSTAVGGQLAQAPGQFAGVKGGMYDSFNKGYGSYNQTLGSLGNSYAQNYAALASGTAGLANALGNTWNNSQANNQAASAAEAARQAAVSNLGTSAMMNYGNVAGQGLQAWAQNQQGYQRSLADMTTGNQAAVSQLGVGRFNALSGLGKSGAAMSVGRDVAAALPGLTGSAGTPGSFAGGADYGMLNGLRADINNNSELNSLNNNFRGSVDRLEADQAIARTTPRTMVNDAREALMDFNKLNLGASAGGMDQFYDFSRESMRNNYRPGQAIPTGSLLDALAAGYSDSAARIGGVQGDLNSGWGDAMAQSGAATRDVNNLFDSTVGNMGMFSSPLQRQQNEWALADAARTRRESEASRQRQEIMNLFGSPDAYGAALAGYDTRRPRR